MSIFLTRIIDEAKTCAEFALRDPAFKYMEATRAMAEKIAALPEHLRIPVETYIDPIRKVQAVPGTVRHRFSLHKPLDIEKGKDVPLGLLIKTPLKLLIADKLSGESMFVQVRFSAEVHGGLEFEMAAMIGEATMDTFTFVGKVDNERYVVRVCGKLDGPEIRCVKILSELTNSTGEPYEINN